MSGWEIDTTLRQPASEELLKDLGLNFLCCIEELQLSDHPEPWQLFVFEGNDEVAPFRVAIRLPELPWERKKAIFRGARGGKSSPDLPALKAIVIQPRDLKKDVQRSLEDDLERLAKESSKYER